jgi:hypothetical protein
MTAIGNNVMINRKESKTLVPLSSLNKKETVINDLIILGCNPDRVDVHDNLAITFLNNFDINHVIASDGTVSHGIKKNGFGGLFGSKYHSLGIKTSDGFEVGQMNSKRKPLGFIMYTKLYSKIIGEVGSLKTLLDNI